MRRRTCASKKAAALINASKRPFIYFGGGLITSEAQEEMLALAEKIDALIGCSLMGLSGIPTDHPRFLGMQGMHGHYASSMAMHDADLIISLGVRFNDRVTGNREKFAKLAQIIHIDVDGSELPKTVNSACGLRGDVKLTLQKLIPLVNAEQKPDCAAVKALKETENDYLDIRPGLYAPQCDHDAEQAPRREYRRCNGRWPAPDVGGAEREL